MTKTCSALCRYADLFGMGSMVEEYDGECDFTEEAMDLPFDLLQEYEEEYVFWETGADMLARRDCSEKYTEEQWAAIPEDDRRMIMFEARQKYHKEWEEHGYGRLRIVEDTKGR